MAYSSSSDYRTGILEYQSHLLSMAESSSSLIPSSISRSISPVHMPRPPLTPPPSPTSDDRPVVYRNEPIRPPEELLKPSAQLALECLHARYSRYDVLPETVIADYEKRLIEDKLGYDNLVILAIFTWNVNSGIPMLSLLGIRQPAGSATVLSELEREQLSKSFSPDMINANCATFYDHYIATMGVALTKNEFRWKVATLMESLGDYYIIFTIVSSALRPNFSVPSSLWFLGRPALESFYEEVKNSNNHDRLPEFVDILIPKLADTTLLILFLLTLDVNPSAFRHGYLTGESINLSQGERSLLAKSLWEPKLDEISDRILARFSELKLDATFKLLSEFCDKLGKHLTQAIVGLTAAGKALDVGIEGKIASEIAYGVNPNEGTFVNLTNDPYPALHHAAANGYAPTVRELLENEFDPNARDPYTLTPLHLAASNGHQEVVELLLSQQYINLNAVDCRGYTPLTCAVMSGAAGIVGLLLEKEGVDVNTTSPTQRPLLQLAIEGAHIGTIRRLLQDPRFDISCRWGCNSPLLAAIRAGRDSITLFVLRQGGLDNVRTPLGENALLLATRKGSLAVVKEILKDNEVDVNSTDHSGWNALRWATREGNREMVQILLAHPRTGVNLFGLDGRSALTIAMHYGYCDIAVLLDQHEEQPARGFR
ncbi:ankyrin repeat-containing domain protein [Aspergillus pseudoustus]|uniref:Ankyrin repeat-containing domain protein n=1 Tax=Aspergillus pseudoustus TaxID=1810923 RepID=A0ABR4IT46_9EURO